MRLWFRLAFPVLLAAAVLFVVAPAGAAYFAQPDSDIDPNIFKIDDKKFLGERLDPNLTLVVEGGREIKARELLGKPSILVFSYYRCDGTCSAVNQVLKEILKETDLQIGDDYQVLTLSFDENDDLSSMETFRKDLALPEGWAEKGWNLALFKDPELIKKTTAQFGYKFFWSAQDQTFFHPNVYMFLSSKGRVVRYLYALTNDKTDMKLAILEAKEGRFRPSQVIQIAVSLCFSYNFEEGRYTYNIPLFVGVGSLLLGITLFISSLRLYRPAGKKRKEDEDEDENVV